MKKLLFFIFFFMSSSTNEHFDNELLFDTQFLLQYEAVTNHLKEHGFEEGFFKTKDGCNINYLYLERPNAAYTVILAAGWLPGRKEGLATFYNLLPESCNILFFDARGHGKSSGSLLKTTWIYGIHEYKDMIGAIDFIQERTNTPIVLYGVCAGAFNAAHALIHLQNTDRLQEYNIKGLIFDSGWASVATASWTVIAAKANESIAKFWAKLYGKKWKDVLHTYPYRSTAYVANKILSIIHSIGFFPAYALQNNKTNLFDKIDCLPIPILYIHSHDDEYVPIQHAKYLAKKSKHAHTWWIKKPSKHACHCLKHKEEYKEQLHYFLEKIAS